jgi:hypothetical protein
MSKANKKRKIQDDDEDTQNTNNSTQETEQIIIEENETNETLEEETLPTGIFTNFNFTLSGKLKDKDNNNISHSTVKGIINEKGGNVVGSPSKNVDFFVVNEENITTLKEKNKKLKNMNYVTYGFIEYFLEKNIAPTDLKTIDSEIYKKIVLHGASTIRVRKNVVSDTVRFPIDCSITCDGFTFDLDDICYFMQRLEAKGASGGWPQLSKDLKEWKRDSHRFIDLNNTSTLKKLYTQLLDSNCFIYKSNIIFDEFKYSNTNLSDEEKQREKKGYENLIKKTKEAFEEIKTSIGVCLEGEMLFNSENIENDISNTPYQSMEHLKEWIEKGIFKANNKKFKKLGKEKKSKAKSNKEKFKLEEFKDLMTNYIDKISKHQEMSAMFIKFQTENIKADKELILSNIETNKIIQTYYKVNF